MDIDIDINKNLLQDRCLKELGIDLKRINVVETVLENISLKKENKSLNKESFKLRKVWFLGLTLVEKHKYIKELVNNSIFKRNKNPKKFLKCLYSFKPVSQDKVKSQFYSKNYIKSKSDTNKILKSELGLDVEIQNCWIGKPKKKGYVLAFKK